MELRKIWKADLTKDGTAVRSVCVKGDGKEVIAACGTDLVFLEAETGHVVDRKRSHNAMVLKVRCSKDGLFFASSSVDGSVVVWRSLNNVGFVTFGLHTPTRMLDWSPVRTELVCGGGEEYHLWKPVDSKISTRKIEMDIVDVKFSGDGERIALMGREGRVRVVRVEEGDVIQTFEFGVGIGIGGFMVQEGVEMFLAADIDCRVSMFRGDNKRLVGRNSLRSEALTYVKVGDFVIFGGVSGRLTVMTGGLSFQGEFETGSEWIWDLGVIGGGKLVMGSRDGSVMLSSIDYGISFDSRGEGYVYRNGINCAVLVEGGIRKEIREKKVIESVRMSRMYVLVQMKDGLKVYKHDMSKVQEIVGDFGGKMYGVSNMHIMEGSGKVVRMMDLTGNEVCRYEFGEDVIGLRPVSAYGDGGLVWCLDGSIYFVMVERKEVVLMVRHEGKRIVKVERGGMSLGVLDEDGLSVYDLRGKEKVRRWNGCRSFEYSNRVRGMIARSDGMEIFVSYGEYGEMSRWVEGDIMGFIGRELIVWKEGGLERVEVPIPIEEMMEKEKWDDVEEMMKLGLRDDEEKILIKELKENGEEELRRYLESRMDGRIGIVEMLREEIGDEGREYEREMEGEDPREVMKRKAQEGDWEGVLRVAEESEMEREIVGMEIGGEYSERAAGMLIRRGMMDGAIRVLMRAKEVEKVAQVRMYLGQWEEAISLSRLHPRVYGVVYPRLMELLVEDGRMYEGLICCFIGRRGEKGEKEIEEELGKMRVRGITGRRMEELQFISIASGLNKGGEGYWVDEERAQGYHCARELEKRGLCRGQSREEAKDGFKKAYYVIGVDREMGLSGIDMKEILMELVIDGWMLGQKRWVAFGAKELGGYEMEKNERVVVQMACRGVREVEECALGCKCVVCGSDFYGSNQSVSLRCGKCGHRGVFSGEGNLLGLVEVKMERELEEGERVEDLVEEEPSGERVLIEDGERFIRETGSEYLVVNRMKETSGVGVRVFYNERMEEVVVCGACGGMFGRDDMVEVMEIEECPICHWRGMVAESEPQPLLELLRSFESESPLPF